MIELMCLVGAILLISGAVFCGWIIAEIMDWYSTRKEVKRKKEYPHLFELVRERDALSCRIGDWYHSEIFVRKREIDLIMKEDIYLPADVKAKNEKRLEQLRNELYAAQMEDTCMEKELAGIRARIADYVISNNIKWAKERGWGSN